MSADLFNAADIPFNLAGEQIDNATTAEGEARVRMLAQSEARKAQSNFPGFGQDWINRPAQVYPLHDDTNENAL